MKRSEAKALLNSYVQARYRASEATMQSIKNGPNHLLLKAAYDAVNESRNARERVLKALMAAEVEHARSITP
jgi:hypothetical protein